MFVLPFEPFRAVRCLLTLPPLQDKALAAQARGASGLIIVDYAGSDSPVIMIAPIDCEPEVQPTTVLLAHV